MPLIRIGTLPSRQRFGTMSPTRRSSALRQGYHQHQRVLRYAEVVVARTCATASSRLPVSPRRPRMSEQGKIAWD